MSDVLVLLTTDYPGQAGDVSFVSNEIQELSRAFDSVLVFSYLPIRGSMTALPSNVRYCGALTSSSRIEGALALLSPTRLLNAAQAAHRELRNPDRQAGVSATLGNIVTGSRFARAITKALRTRGVTAKDDVFLYSFWGTHAALAVPFVVEAKRKTVRLHRFDLYEEQNPRLPMRASLFHSADALVPISTDGQKYLKDRYGDAILDTRKVFLSRLGVSDPTRVTEDASSEVTSKVSSDDDSVSGPIRIVSCSSLIPVKNVAAIIPALQEVAKQHPVSWIHFGGGELEQSIRQATEIAMRETNNLEIVLNGQTPHDQVIGYYRSNPVDVFVNVSDSEGVPVSIMEALSFDIPVVATDAGGTGEIVNEDLASGVLIPVRPSTQQIAEAIQHVVDHRGDFRPREVWETMADATVQSREIARIIRGEQP